MSTDRKAALILGTTLAVNATALALCRGHNTFWITTAAVALNGLLVPASKKAVTNAFHEIKNELNSGKLQWTNRCADCGTKMKRRRKKGKLLPLHRYCPNCAKLIETL
jgi:hypothetical protein